MRRGSSKNCDGKGGQRISNNHRFRRFFLHRFEGDWHFSEEPIHLTDAECRAAQKLETGWLLAQMLGSQPDSVWQFVRERQRRRPLNQLEHTS